MGNTINVVVGHNSDRFQKLYADTTTIREILEDNEIDYGCGVTTLDGTTVRELDKTLADYGITNRCCLFSIIKTNNA